MGRLYLIVRVDYAVLSDLLAVVRRSINWWGDATSGEEGRKDGFDFRRVFLRRELIDLLLTNGNDIQSCWQVCLGHETC